MEWQERRDALTEVANEITVLAQKIRTNWTDNEQLEILNIKLRSAQQRLEALVAMGKVV